MEGEHYKSNYTDGPAEADTGKSSFNDAREEHATCCGAGGGNANSDGAISGEVGRDQGEGGTEKETGADTSADALGEE